MYKCNPCLLSMDHTGAATPTLNSEIFTQSNRLAAFVLVGLHRWLFFAVLGLIFPFIIVNTIYPQTSIAFEHPQICVLCCRLYSPISSHRKLSVRTASCCLPVCACWVHFIPFSFCLRLKAKPCWRSQRSLKPSLSVGNLSQKRREWRPSSEEGCMLLQIIGKNMRNCLND